MEKLYNNSGSVDKAEVGCGSGRRWSNMDIPFWGVTLEVQWLSKVVVE